MDTPILPEEAPSLWADTTPQTDLSERLSGMTVTDVIIIGGGFTGLSAAYHLASSGIEPLVLEAGRIGLGGSGRNGGVVSAKFRKTFPQILSDYGIETAKRLYEISHESVDEVEKLVSALDITSANFSRTGSLRCAHNPSALSMIVEEADWLHRNLGDTSLKVLSDDEVAYETGSTSFCGGVMSLTSGVIRPLAYLRGLYSGLKTKGVRIHEFSPAISFRVENGRIIVTTPEGEVSAGKMILATNAYSGITGISRPVQLSLVPFRSAMIATEVLSSALNDKLLPHARSYTETRRMMRWFRKVDGRIVFGGRGALGKVNAPEAFIRLQKAMVRLFPELEDVKIDYQWSGHVALTLDALPYIGQIDERIYCAAGFNGAGVAMSTLSGRYAAQLLCGEPIDLSILAHPPRRIPFYMLREPVIRAGAAWNEFLDFIGK